MFNNKKRKTRKQFISEIIGILITILIAIVIRSLLFEPFRIPSSSMVPTLLVGDQLFVSKYSYGYSKYSFPFSIIPFKGRIPSKTVLKRGDVIVFRVPYNPNINYIKRVIGLPYDVIQMKKGRLFINDTMVSRKNIKNYHFVNYKYSINIEAPQYIETLPNGLSHKIIEVFGDNGSKDNTGKYVVPAGHFFAMGDNRDLSEDSRYKHVGYIPIENVVGSAKVIWLSIDYGGKVWWKFWHWSFRFRHLGLLYAKQNSN